MYFRERTAYRSTTVVQPSALTSVNFFCLGCYSGLNFCNDFGGF